MVRRFRRRGSMRKARSFIRRTVVNMGPIETKRIRLESVAIPARSSVAWDNPVQIPLVVAGDTVDESLVSDGTNIAQVRNYSKIVGLKANLMIHGGSAGAIYRWVLYKSPDGDVTASSLVGSGDYFHNSNETETARTFRGLVAAKGWGIVTDKTGIRLNVFVRRKTLRRLGSLRENDRWTLAIATSDSASSAVSGFGQLYVRMN